MRLFIILWCLTFSSFASIIGDVILHEGNANIERTDGEDVDAEKLKNLLLKTYDKRGAEYPAEHNVGHEYTAKPTLRKFYKDLDPTNAFNPGIGRTSKSKNWK